jgi:hypothetical protein
MKLEAFVLEEVEEALSNLVATVYEGRKEFVSNTVFVEVWS